MEAGSDPMGQPRRAGVLERAHGGTLLLDEVADMPLETQGKIVRALQEQGFERIGGATRVKVDVRVVATSNRDLQAEIPGGRCREDLFYRLAVAPLKVPALRDRREDAMAALQAYDWPGNVRQLRNLIDWLLIMAPGEPREAIRAEMLPPEVGSAAPAMLKLDRSSEIMTLPLREARELFEKQYLEAQLLRFGGNISRTAHFVGMERSALHRKLKFLGVQAEDRGPAAVPGA